MTDLSLVLLVNILNTYLADIQECSLQSGTSDKLLHIFLPVIQTITETAKQSAKRIKGKMTLEQIQDFVKGGCHLPTPDS